MVIHIKFEGYTWKGFAKSSKQIKKTYIYYKGALKSENRRKKKEPFERLLAICKTMFQSRCRLESINNSRRSTAECERLVPVSSLGISLPIELTFGTWQSTIKINLVAYYVTWFRLHDKVHAFFFLFFFAFFSLLSF